MAHMLDLPSELLSIIVTFLVMSTDDLKDFVYLCATCKTISIAAIKPDILRLIKFKNVSPVEHPEHFYHINGLLSKCVQVGNADAGPLMCLVVLFGGAPLWEKILENRLTCLSIKCATTFPIAQRRCIANTLITGSIAELPYLLFFLEDKPQLREYYSRLHHLRLVLLFFCRADFKDITNVSPNLKDFLEFFLGYHKYTRRGKPISEAVLEITGADKLPGGRGSDLYITQIISAIDDQLKQEE